MDVSRRDLIKLGTAAAAGGRGREIDLGALLAGGVDVGGDRAQAA